MCGLQERKPGDAALSSHTGHALGRGLAAQVQRFRSGLLLGLIAAAVIAADQVTKSWAENALRSRPEHVIGPFWFRLVFNTGAAFSLGRGLAPALAILAILAVGGIIVATRSASSLWTVVAGGLVAGGALGNLADRVFRHNSGAVVDFIYTRFWPTFNVADSCITVGIALLVVTTVFRNQHD